MAGRPLALGVDVGATKVLAAAVGARGQASSVVQLPTPAKEGPAAVARAILDAAEACQEAAGGVATSIGVGFAGQVRKGAVLSCPNMSGWRNVPLAARLRRRLGAPVTLANDARAAAWAESRFGGHGARGSRDLVFLALGTGVGAGVVSAGALLEGAAGCAGELGHVPVVAGGRPCSCGGRGCLEAYAGGWALAREARRAARLDPRAGRALLARAGPPARLDAHALARAHAKGDPLAGRILGEARQAVGAACAGIANALNPQTLVLGGGLAEGFPAFLDEARRGVARGLGPARGVRVVRTALGPAAVAVGAADLARRAAWPNMFGRPQA